MRLLHSAKDTSVRFDEPNLVSCVGLVPVMRLAQDCDLAGLVAEHLKVTAAVGANAHLKIPGIVAGRDREPDLPAARRSEAGRSVGVRLPVQGAPRGGRPAPPVQGEGPWPDRNGRGLLGRGPSLKRPQPQRAPQHEEAPLQESPPRWRLRLPRCWRALAADP